MSTEQTLSTIKAINEEKHQVHQYLESLARHRDLKHHSITIHADLQSQTFIVTPQIVQLIIDDLDKYYQRRNMELIEKAEILIAEK